ncbi:MAG: hypothetical protein ABNH38_18645 [Tateyamaria sp.]|jgi:hypothetical protein|uniref:hypothetical protein n=1 Tax=Tateyamaria sp. TaxID=1929288 RepID=UPI0032DC7F1C
MSNEEEKLGIGKLRDDALTMQVGDENDGPISGMVSVANTDMYIIKKHAIYRTFLADEIDPERTNSNIPNGYQKIVSQGSDSETVARSFLTANVLFNSNQFYGEIDLKRVMDLSIVVMKELLAARTIERDLITEQDRALSAFQQPKQRSLALPSVEGLNESLKTFVQKIEHATQAIFAFTQQFYGHRAKMWNGFETEIQQRYGASDEFSKFVGSMTTFMVFIRNLRNCVEHPKDAQRVIIRDFAITADGTLTPPTVEVVHAATPQPKMEVSSFLPQVAGQALDIFEVLMIHLASKHIAPFGKFEKTVGFLPPDQVAADSKVRASYFILFNDRWSKVS